MPAVRRMRTRAPRGPLRSGGRRGGAGAARWSCRGPGPERVDDRRRAPCRGKPAPAASPRRNDARPGHVTVRGGSVGRDPAGARACHPRRCGTGEGAARPMPSACRTAGWPRARPSGPGHRRRLHARAGAWAGPGGGASGGAGLHRRDRAAPARRDPRPVRCPALPGAAIARRGALVTFLNPKLSIFVLALPPPVPSSDPATATAEMAGPGSVVMAMTFGVSASTACAPPRCGTGRRPRPGSWPGRTGPAPRSSARSRCGSPTNGRDPLLALPDRRTGPGAAGGSVRWVSTHRPRPLPFGARPPIDPA